MAFPGDAGACPYTPNTIGSARLFASPPNLAKSFPVLYNSQNRLLFVSPTIKLRVMFLHIVLPFLDGMWLPGGCFMPLLMGYYKPYRWNEYLSLSVFSHPLESMYLIQYALHLSLIWSS